MAAAVSIRAVRAAGQTGGGDQDFTVSGFGTPKAAIFLCSLGVTDGTAADGGAMSFGATDGTTHFVTTTYDEHGVGDSDCYANAATDEVVMILAADGTIDGEANFNSWITDGVRITWGNAPAAAYLITVILIGGNDVSAKVDTINMGTATTEQTYASAGFLPMCGIFRYATIPFASLDTPIAGVRNRTGLAVGHEHLINQCGYEITSTDAAANAANSRYMCQFGVGTGLTTFGTCITEFNSAGFKYINNASASSNSLHFLLLSVANGAVTTGIYDAKTSTGNKSFNFGFKPIATFWIISNLTAAVARSDGMVGEAAEDVGDGSYWGGFGISTGSEEFSVTHASEDGAATMNTQSLSDDKCPVSGHDDGTLQAVGTHVSFDNLGQTINFTTAAGGAYKYLVMAFTDGADTGSGSGGLLSGNKRGHKQ